MLVVQYYPIASWHKKTTWPVPKHHVKECETRIFNFGGGRGGGGDMPITSNRCMRSCSQSKRPRGRLSNLFKEEEQVCLHKHTSALPCWVVMPSWFHTNHGASYNRQTPVRRLHVEQSCKLLLSYFVNSCWCHLTQCLDREWVVHTRHHAKQKQRTSVPVLPKNHQP